MKNNFNNRVKAPGIVTILALSLITIVFWVGFETFRSVTTKPTSPVPEEILSALNPSLDTQALGDLSSRIYLAEEEIHTQIAASPSPTPATATVSSPSATPATATASGQVP